MAIVNFENKRLGNKGAYVVAGFIQSGQVQTKTSVNLSNNQIGAKGKKDIAHALVSGAAEHGLALNLSHNANGHDGDLAIIKALGSGKCPDYMSLDMSYQGLGSQLLKALVVALKSNRMPRNLTLTINNNKFNAKNLHDILFKAIAKNSCKCPIGLKINVAEQLNDKGSSISGDVQKQLDELIRSHTVEVKDKAKSSLKDVSLFARNKKMRVSHADLPVVAKQL
jgi:hypothetical protein